MQIKKPVPEATGLANSISRVDGMNLVNSRISRGAPAFR